MIPFGQCAEFVNPLRWVSPVLPIPHLEMRCWVQDCLAQGHPASRGQCWNQNIHLLWSTVSTSGWSAWKLQSAIQMQDVCHWYFSKLRTFTRVERPSGWGARYGEKGEGGQNTHTLIIHTSIKDLYCMAEEGKCIHCTIYVFYSVCSTKDFIAGILGRVCKFRNRIFSSLRVIFKIKMYSCQYQVLRFRFSRVLKVFHVQGKSQYLGWEMTPL